MKALSWQSGIHHLAELSGCTLSDPVLFNHQLLGEYIASLVAQCGLTALSHTGYTFDDGGVTTVVALAESHVSIHTWPERAYVTLDVFVCNHSQDNRAHGERLFQMLCDLCKPQDRVVRSIHR